MSRLPVAWDRIALQEHVLVALVGAFSLSDLALLLADVGPCLVQLDAADLQVNHHAVVQFGVAFADPDAKAHDGVAVHAGRALGRSVAHALG